MNCRRVFLCILLYKLCLILRIYGHCSGDYKSETLSHIVKVYPEVIFELIHPVEHGIAVQVKADAGVLQRMVMQDIAQQCAAVIRAVPAGVASPYSSSSESSSFDAEMLLKL
mgnify:CR=1 FL=1